MIDIEDIRKIYFIGIGGIGMSATAGIAAEAGYEVSGSDSHAVYDPAKRVLDDKGVKYHIGYDAAHIEAVNADLYILSAGEDQNNPEVAYLIEHNLPYHNFSELLYELSRDKIRIVVTGTHGKSTTSSLLGHVLFNIDQSSFMTGAVLQHYETNFECGPGHYFVFEGDEYKSLFDDPTPKFHYYKPDIVVLTNLEYDHPDVYASLEELKDEFRLLLSELPDDGLVIYNSDDANLAQLVHETNVGAVSFGVHNEADYKVDSIIYGAITEFDVAHKGETEHYQINLTGEINVYNALAGIAALRSLGFQPEIIQQHLLTYNGIKRRLEKVGEKDGVIVYDDYAHHPTAVRQTLAAARTRHPEARLWAVFEPHTFSRTQATLPDLVNSFADADEVIISEIYPARERKNVSTITGEEVVAAVCEHHKARLVKDKAEALALLRAELKPGDVVIVMAVGSFNTLASDLVK